MSSNNLGHERKLTESHKTRPNAVVVQKEDTHTNVAHLNFNQLKAVFPELETDNSNSPIQQLTEIEKVIWLCLIFKYVIIASSSVDDNYATPTTMADATYPQSQTMLSTMHTIRPPPSPKPPVLVMEKSSILLQVQETLHPTRYTC